MNQDKSKWRRAIKIILFLAILSFVVSWFFSIFLEDDFDFKDGNVALIPIKGVITSEEGSSFGQDVTASQNIIKFIEQADKNPKIKAIILEINSPGGSPVATEEIADALKKTNKTKVAWIREIGTSGAYWIASSSDKIVASRMSFIGSIGVMASYLQFSGLLEDYNVTYERLTAGQFKDIGTSFKTLSMQERQLLQKELDKLHDYFIEAVAENRKLPEEKVREMATGIFYLGEEALDLGLIDVLGGKDEAVEIIENKLNITVGLVEYKVEKRLVDILGDLSSKQSFFVGKGIGSSVLDARKASRIEVWT